MSKNSENNRNNAPCGDNVIGVFFFTPTHNVKYESSDDAKNNQHDNEIVLKKTQNKRVHYKKRTKEINRIGKKSKLSNSETKG